MVVGDRPVEQLRQPVSRIIRPGAKLLRDSGQPQQHRVVDMLHGDQPQRFDRFNIKLLPGGKFQRGAEIENRSGRGRRIRSGRRRFRRRGGAAGQKRRPDAAGQQPQPLPVPVPPAHCACGMNFSTSGMGFSVSNVQPILSVRNSPPKCIVMIFSGVLQMTCASPVRSP